MSAPMYLRRPGRTSKSATDVPAATPEEMAPSIVECLRVKGFCVITDAVPADELQSAQEAIAKVDKWAQPSSLISDGLLGDEGSSQIVKLEMTDRKVKPPSESGLDGIDFMMWQLADALIPPCQEELGFNCGKRSQTILHKADFAEFTDAELDDREADEWREIFITHRIIIMIFLGPKRGTLELQPYDEDGNPVEIMTEAGFVVVARTNELSYRFFTKDSTSTYVATCFMLQPSILKMHPKKMEENMVPAARELEGFRMNRLSEIKELEEEDDATVPQSWLSAANRLFFKQQLINVRSACCRLPSSWQCEVFFISALSQGPDVVLEVPLQRWDHDLYFKEEADRAEDDPPLTSCKHGAWVDGCDLFDAKHFGMTQAEVKETDPCQRLALEATAEAMVDAGYKKVSGLTYPIGMFMGFSISEWYHAVDRPPSTIGVYSITGYSHSIAAGRLSYHFGCKGPAVAVDTDQASSLTAVFQASESLQKKGIFTPSEAACALGAHLTQAPVIWLARSQTGSFSNTGRCFTFDQSANGLVVSDGVGCVLLKPRTSVVDEEEVFDRTPSVGALVGGATNNSGGRASNVRSPHATSLQELLVDALEASNISAGDLDIIECHGSSFNTGDYIEVMATATILRGQPDEPGGDALLQACCSKPNLGNSIEMAGLTALIKTMHHIRWGHILANIHARRSNERIDLQQSPCETLSWATEHVQQRLSNNAGNVFAGVTAFGWGGTNVHLQCFGAVDEAVRPPPEPTPDEAKPRLLYWPAGGGDLDFQTRPRKGYFITGTFNEWKDSVQMQSEGNGCYGYTLVVGENRWEQFQILLDGSLSKVMHPGQYKAPKCTRVYGPNDLEGSHELTWLLDGRRIFEKTAELEEASSRRGQVGDRYRVWVHVAGKWMVVNWAKLEDTIPLAPAAPLQPAAYILRGSWNDYDAMLLDPIETKPGHYATQITLRGTGGNFIIYRNDDTAQAIYPARSGAPTNAIIGPDDHVEGLEWSLRGRPGDTFRIEFQRIVEEGKDMMKLDWQRV